MRCPVTSRRHGPWLACLTLLIPLTCITAAPVARTPSCVDYSAQLRLLSSLSLPQGSANDVVVDGHFAYVATAAAVVVVDWSDPAAPILATSVPVAAGLRDLALGDQVLYAVDGLGSLQVYDLAVPLSPSSAGSVTPVSPAVALSVDGARACLVLAAGGVQCADLSTPLSPVLGAFLSLPDGNRNVDIRGTVAYVVGRGLDSNYFGQFYAVDIASTAQPVLLGSYATDSGGAGWGNAYEDVFAGDDGVFVVNEYYWLDFDPFFYHSVRYFREFDVGDPGHPLPAAAVVASTSYLRGVVLDGRVAVVASDGPNEADPPCNWSRHSLKVKDAATGSTAPLTAVVDLPAAPRELVAAGDHFLVAGGSAGLLIVDASVLQFGTDPGAVRSRSVENMIACVNGSGNLLATSLAYSGGHYPGDDSYAWIKIYDLALDTADVEDSRVGNWFQVYAALPGVLTFVTDQYLYAGSMIFSLTALPDVSIVGYAPEDVGPSILIGDRLVYRNNARTLRTLDVGDPVHPVFVGGPVLASVTDLSARGDLIYATTTSTLEVLRLESDGTLTPLASVPAASATAVAVDGDRLAVGTSGGSLMFYDLADPDLPQLTGQIELGAPVTDLALAERAYVALGPGAWAVVDPGDGTDPRWEGGIEGNHGTQVLLGADELLLADECPAQLWFMGRACDSTTSAPSDPAPANRRLAFASVWPNPANPSTTVSFSLSRDGHLRADVFDLAGRRLARLADAPYQAGDHRLEWNGRDASGHVAATGAYLVRLQLDGESAARRFMLLR